MPASKPTSKTRKKNGRPKFKIDYEEVKKLASIMCTQEEISSFLGCSVDTLQRDSKFCGIYKNGIDNGKMSLRRVQYAKAKSGNVTMLIWLGKQYLNQRDRQEIKTTISGDGLVKSIDAFVDKL